MKFFNFFGFSKAEEKPKTKKGSFSDFFLNASDKEVKDVINQAARKANEEQKKVFLKATSNQRT